MRLFRNISVVAALVGGIFVAQHSFAEVGAVVKDSTALNIKDSQIVHDLNIVK
jgi:uncharacterized membrane protein